MAGSALLEYVQKGDFQGFEARCLEMLESGEARIEELAGPFRQLEKRGQTDLITGLGPMLLENVTESADPRAVLDITRVTLNVDPDNELLRARAIESYRRVYGDSPGFEAFLSASGLTTGRPTRNALRLLDTCLAARIGDSLISRMDDRVAEITGIDLEHGLFTLRSGGRIKTVPAAEMLREYDPVDANDFRALRQLDPERVTQMLQDDPVKMVISILHAHGESLDVDVMKQDLVPKYIDEKDWSKWWTRTRTLLKRCPYVAIEGRSPMLLTHIPEGRTIEDETWDAFSAESNPAKWVALVEGYVREKTQRKEAPAAELLARVEERIVAEVQQYRERRSLDALTAALALRRLADKGLPISEPARGLAASLLDTDDPVPAIARLNDDMFWEAALQVAAEVRPETWPRSAGRLIPSAPAAVLDTLASAAIEGGQPDAVRLAIDEAISAPHQFPELVYWMWKGPKKHARLTLPPDEELFAQIIDTLAALDRTLSASDTVTKTFRHRMKAGLALRGYAKARACLAATPVERAVTLRNQLERLEGLGDNTKYKLVDLLRDVHPALWVKPQKRIEPWEDERTLWATDAGLKRRTAERDHLVNVEMRDNARRIGEAASHGDLSENSEYKFALEERDLLRARLARMNEEISAARTLSPQDVDASRVTIGTRVELRDSAGGTRIMTFLGPFETDVDAGIYNYRSPVGQKLMGGHVGDRVVIKEDHGDVEYEVAAITNGMQTIAGA